MSNNEQPARLIDFSEAEQRQLAEALAKLASDRSVGIASPDAERVFTAFRRVLSPQWSEQWLTVYAVERVRSMSRSELRSIAASELTRIGKVDAGDIIAASAFLANELSRELPIMLEGVGTCGLNASFASYLEQRFGDTKTAEEVRAWSGDVGDSPSERLRRWVDASLVSDTDAPPPALRLWFWALWRHRDEAKWSKFRRSSASMSKAAMDASILRLSEVPAKGPQLALPFVRPTISEGMDQALATRLDSAIVQRLHAAEGRLLSLTWFRLLTWLVRTGHHLETLHRSGSHFELVDGGAFQLTGASSSHATAVSVTIRGGYQSLAHTLGLASSKDAVDVRNLVTFMALNEFDFGHGQRGNMLGYRETSAHPGRPAELFLSILHPLLPSYVYEYPHGKQRRRRVPIYDREPSLEGLRPNDKGPAIALFLRGLREFRDRASELDARQHVTMDWPALGRLYGLSPKVANKAVDAWADSGDLGRDGQRWTLGPGQSKALRFILDGARLERPRGPRRP